MGREGGGAESVAMETSRRNAREGLSPRRKYKTKNLHFKKYLR